LTGNTPRALFDLGGRPAIVTGATRAIDPTIAVAAVACGANVGAAVAGRTPEPKQRMVPA
jgi:NAD(P)-dependent dehydrogenase (short-subunit alcohol dehydrogenase family)